jgi:hypothetical protein
MVVNLTDNELELLAGVLNDAQSLDGPSVDHSTRCRGGRPPTPEAIPSMSGPFVGELAQPPRMVLDVEVEEIDGV